MNFGVKMHNTYREKQEGIDYREAYLKQKYEAKIALSKSGRRNINAMSGDHRRKRMSVQPDDPDYMAYKEMLNQKQIHNTSIKTNESVDQTVPNLKIIPNDDLLRSLQYNN